MKANGNLAGVEFVTAPRFHRDAETWATIITESGYWFTKAAMAYFGSRVAWDSLTPTADGYLFISSERDNGGAWDGVRRYTVRAWNMDNGVLAASEFGQFDTMAQAKRYLAGAR